MIIVLYLSFTYPLAIRYLPFCDPIFYLSSGKEFQDDKTYFFLETMKKANDFFQRKMCSVGSIGSTGNFFF